jgi:hypothetical protein
LNSSPLLPPLSIEREMDGWMDTNPLRRAAESYQYFRLFTRKHIQQLIKKKGFITYTRDAAYI